MHITLLNPPQVFTKTQVTAGVVPPLGILSLAAQLKRAHHDVKVIDAVGEKYYQYTNFKHIQLRGLTFQEIISEIIEDTDLIGISSMFSFAHFVIRELVREIRSRFPAKRIVLGGAHPTVLPKIVLEETDADIVVLGEGEETLLDLCCNLNDYSQVKGIAYKKEGKIYVNVHRELVKDLDSLALPCREVINLENYFKAAEPHGCSRFQRWTTILASRGCPYACSFCTTPIIWRRHWRTRSVDSVIQEMHYLYETFGVVDFHFEDENLGFDKKWMHQFCDALIDKRLPIAWQPSNGLRAETVADEKLLEKMKKSGCSLIVVAVESVSNRVRNEIVKKTLDISSIEKVISLANKVGLKTTCYFIIGFPGERLKEAKESIEYVGYLARQGLDECVISVFSLLPGCELFDKFYNEGKVKLDYEFFNNLLCLGDLASFHCWTEYISGEQLRKLRIYGYLKFHFLKTVFYPGKIVRSIYNILRKSDELKSERVIRTYLKRLSPFF